jgi:methionyl aminopeptidase
MIVLKSPEEIEKIRKASQIVAASLLALKAMAKPGVMTQEMDRFVDQHIRDLGGIPAFKGYRNFPASLCVSINNEVVHGIPSKRVIKDGDIVSLDLGVNYKGYYGDAALTVSMGEPSPIVKRLIQVTEESLYRGIEAARIGARLSDISHAIESHIQPEGFGIVTEYVGHGIGRSLHEEPQVPNFGPPGKGPKLREGMVLAIEPMVNIGKSDVRVLADRWTAVTADGSLSAHFEHTVCITKTGPVILSALAQK